MSNVSPFLSYSTHENAATNNTLLLAKFIHERGSRRFQAFLNYLIGTDFEVPLGVQFSQQTRQSHSVPDGAIFQEPFKLLIETKVVPSTDIHQLCNHVSGMSKEMGVKYLLWLLPDRIPSTLEESARQKITQIDPAVRFAAITFEDVIEAARIEEACPLHDEELKFRINEYEDFCNAKLLLKKPGVWMRAVGCGATLSINRDYKIYFDQCRNTSPHDFVGAYSLKAIRGIGRIGRIVRCDEYKGKLENITDAYEKATLLTEDESNRILQSIQIARKTCGYSMSERHQYYLFDQWADTEFKKTTKHPLPGAKFFDLTEYVDKKTVESRNTSEIARKLQNCGWE